VSGNDRHGWTHPFCDACFDDYRPGARPLRLVEVEAETCCRCGGIADTGIYVREDPKVLVRCPDTLFPGDHADR
jgi:hypothetical protein